LKSTNLWSPSQVLRSREAWKYKRLAKYLKKRNRPHKFEYRLSNRVFDLALLDTQTLVEFDGKYHCGAQLKDDRKKDRLARKHGFEVVRLPDTSSEALSPSLLRGL
jgi:very-short-patch-repair endonuclease